jgi:type IV secretory pathway TraG/TraD family ATPase VirD4
MDTAIHHVLSLNPNSRKALWFFIDEFSSLHKLPSIMDFLSRGRKFKGSLVAAVQSLSQIEATYGPKDSSTLIGLFGTLIQHRVGDISSAQKASKILGNKETLSPQEGLSYGASDTRDGVNIQHQIREEALVMPSEIMNLKDLEAFIKIPGNFPISKIKLTYKSRR